MTSVTVIIPVYNEGASLAARLVSIADSFSIYRGGGYTFNYLVIDDGSVDETLMVAKMFASGRHNVDVVSHPRNLGLGAALRTAFARVKTEYAIALDADLSYPPATGMELLEALERENADIALASPYMAGGVVKNVPPLRRFLSREANRLLSLAAFGRCSTLSCMVRAYRTSALRNIEFRGDRMDAVAEIALVAIRKGLRIVEIPATLQWSEERCAVPNRLNPVRLAQQSWATVRLAFEYRPTLWLAVPGLVPGLLPLVVAVLLIIHASTAVLAAGTAITIVVQYASLAIFAGQLGAFLRRTFVRHQRTPERIANHDCKSPPHVA